MVNDRLVRDAHAGLSCNELTLRAHCSRPSHLSSDRNGWTADIYRRPITADHQVDRSVKRCQKPEPQSALVVLVPAAEELVARFRAAHDPAAAAGMPAHITILFPFRPPSQIDVTTNERLKACFHAYEPFDFELVEARRFPGVIYLAPEPDDPLKTLTLAVWEAFPEHPPYEGKHPDVIPHLTVAQDVDEQVLGCIWSDFEVVAKRFFPLPAKATEVALMDNSSGSWRVAKTFNLGRL